MISLPTYAYTHSHRHQVPIHHEAMLLLVEEHERRMEQRGQRGNDREGERWRRQGGDLQLRFDNHCVSAATATAKQHTIRRSGIGW